MLTFLYSMIIFMRNNKCYVNSLYSYSCICFQLTAACRMSKCCIVLFIILNMKSFNDIISSDVYSRCIYKSKRYILSLGNINVYPHRKPSSLRSACKEQLYMSAKYFIPDKNMFKCTWVKLECLTEYTLLLRKKIHIFFVKSKIINYMTSASPTPKTLT